jgi:hypothetical protein
MSNTALRSSWLIVGWIAAVAMIMVASTATGANLSTTALLVALGIAPGVVVALLAHRAPSPSVAQILHSAAAKDGRS